MREGNLRTLKNRLVKFLAPPVILVTAIYVLAGCEGPTDVPPLPPQPRLRVATTTSLYDTGLWGYLEPMFERKYRVELDVIYAGSGRAIELGRRGDVDVVTVHDPALEDKFIADGYGVRRIPFAYNYFVIVGPPSDPAGIKGMSPEDAFSRLADGNGGSFVSRGDESGTHSMEKKIWANAGYNYEKVRKETGWYVEGGRGMGPTLMMTNEKRAYTLTDAGTFLAYKGKLELVPLVEKGDILLNVYSVIAVNPDKVPGVKSDLSARLVELMVSPETQKLIGNYGVKEYGRQLFTPFSGSEPKQVGDNE
ncbi:MAG: substrate-binding domain-containing protein [Chloroflexi bacterium]|nr:substrate-binding domain-containing protein [Chloroflexota bacterium]